MLKNKDKRNGLIGTILFHAILLLIFIFYGLTYQYPPPEQGILINFGTSDEGVGEIQPIESSQQEVVEETEEVPETTSEIVESEEEVLTQEVVETIEVPKETEAEKKERIEKEEREKKEKEFKKKMTNIWKNRESKSEGETGKSGDQGSPEGLLEAKSHVGGGSGNGVGFKLLGRKMLKPPNIFDTSQEEGKVVVNIIVDKNGKVIKAIPGARGSTTTSAHLFRKAKEAALKAKFSPAKDIYTPEEQKGIMTFVFILN